MGSLQHQPTGITVSNVAEVNCDGQAYQLCREDVQIDGIIGHGAAGRVELGSHKQSGQRFAIKTMKVASKELRQQMLHEIQGLMEAEGSPHIVQLYFVFLEAAKLGLVLEYMDMGCLAALKTAAGEQGTPSRMLANIAGQVVHGLHYIHSKAILHRDIKPGNILHNSLGCVKLTDFGLSKSVTGFPAAATATPVGTRFYMSPERVLGDDYSFAADVWSVGVVVYELAAHHPFPGKSYPELCKELLDEPEPRLDHQRYPELLCNFVAVTLVRDPTKRELTSSLLEHPYICANCASRDELADWLRTLPRADAL